MPASALARSQAPKKPTNPKENPNSRPLPKKRGESHTPRDSPRLTCRRASSILLARFCAACLRAMGCSTSRDINRAWLTYTGERPLPCPWPRPGGFSPRARPAWPRPGRLGIAPSDVPWDSIEDDAPAHQTPPPSDVRLRPAALFSLPPRRRARAHAPAPRRRRPMGGRPSPSPSWRTSSTSWRGGPRSWATGRGRASLGPGAAFRTTSTTSSGRARTRRSPARPRLRARRRPPRLTRRPPLPPAHTVCSRTWKPARCSASCAAPGASRTTSASSTPCGPARCTRTCSPTDSRTWRARRVLNAHSSPIHSLHTPPSP